VVEVDGGRWAAVVRSAARWALVAAVLVISWLGGIAFWGPPEPRGIFRDTSFWSSPEFVFVVTFPAMVAAGLALRSRRRRLPGLVLLVASVVLGAWTEIGSQFGGICFDPGDTCNVTWSSRFAALLVGLAAVVAGFVAESWGRRSVVVGEV
jgi:hypothetical protein